MTTLTLTEILALKKLRASRGVRIQGVARYEGKLYARIFTTTYVLEDEYFVRADCMFPTVGFHQCVARIEWD
jgi:hypothetical protein